MPRAAITAPDGTRWVLRSAHTRAPQCFPAVRSGDHETLRVLPGGVLGRLPLPIGHPALELGEQRAGGTELSGGVLVSEYPSSWQLAALMAEWRDTRRPDAAGRRWVVTLEARGRIRRGASWLLDPGAGADTAARVADQVVAAVSLGRPPAPDDATLLDAWDRRPNHPGVYR